MAGILSRSAASVRVRPLRVLERLRRAPGCLGMDVMVCRPKGFEGGLGLRVRGRAAGLAPWTRGPRK